MSLYCLGCGDLLISRGVLVSRISANNCEVFPKNVECENGRAFVRCTKCSGRNFLIKEYAMGGVFLRLSHLVPENNTIDWRQPPVYARLNPGGMLSTNA